MTNIEHLIETSLVYLDDDKMNYDEWYEHIKDNWNWEDTFITLEELWYITQYVVYTYKPCLIYDIEEKYGIQIDN